LDWHSRNDDAFAIDDVNVERLNQRGIDYQGIGGRDDPRRCRI